MGGGGIVAIISAVLTLLVMWWKRHDSPQKTRERIINETKERLDELAKTIARGDVDDITRDFADFYNRVLRESSSIHPRGNDRKTG